MTSTTVSTQASNTPAIIVGDGATGVTVLAANTGANLNSTTAQTQRIGFSIQNVGTTAAYIRFGANASATVYHYALKGGSADNDGLGGSISFTAGAIYSGLITMFGTSTAKVVALEIAP